MNVTKKPLRQDAVRRCARWLLLLPALVVVLNGCMIVPLGYPAYGHGRYHGGYDSYSHEGYRGHHDRY